MPTTQLPVGNLIAPSGMPTKIGPSPRAMRRQRSERRLLHGDRSKARTTGAAAGGGLKGGVIHPGAVAGSGKAAKASRYRCALFLLSRFPVAASWLIVDNTSHPRGCAEISVHLSARLHTVRGV